MSRRQATAYSRMQREIRKAQAAAHEAALRQQQRQQITGPVLDVGTGQTIIRMQRYQPPLRTLVEAKKIGLLELQAAEQIMQATFAIQAGGWLSAALLERIAHGRNDNDWSLDVAIAVRCYQNWQNHWTAEWKRTRNPMLEVIWSAVADEQPIVTIAAAIGYGRTRTTRAIVAGIRHYAAWANMVTGNQRRAWLEAAHRVFDRRLATLGEATGGPAEATGAF